MVWIWKQEKEWHDEYANLLFFFSQIVELVRLEEFYFVKQWWPTKLWHHSTWVVKQSQTLRLFKVVHLTWTGNNVRAAGARVIGHVLKKNSTLKELNFAGLSDCNTVYGSVMIVCNVDGFLFEVIDSKWDWRPWSRIYCWWIKGKHISDSSKPLEYAL